MWVGTKARVCFGTGVRTVLLQRYGTLVRLSEEHLGNQGSQAETRYNSVSVSLFALVTCHCMCIVFYAY